MITPSAGAVLDSLPNYAGNGGTISALNSPLNREQFGIPSEWYVLTNADLTAAITEFVNRFDAEFFEVSNSLSHIYEEEEELSEIYFFDEVPIVYFPPTKVGTFTMEVTSREQGRVETIFTPNDL